MADVCMACGFLPCRCDEDDGWLYKESEDGMTPNEFLQWHRSMGYGDLKLDKPVEIPWDDLLKLVQLVLIFTNSTANPEEVARQLLPNIRGA